MSSSRQQDPRHRGHREFGDDTRTVDLRGDDYLLPESDEIIRRVMDMIESSPSMPMSSSVRVNKEEVLEMLGDALDRLPEELRQAKWLLKDREAFLADREREGEAIVERAALNAARLVERREIVKNAEARAAEILEAATRSARRRQREADDYCDQQLARYENALVKLHKQVSKIRDRLSAPSLEETELGEASLGGPDGRGGADRPTRSGTRGAGPATGQTRAVRSRQRPADPGGEQTEATNRPQRRAAVFDQDG